MRTDFALTGNNGPARVLGGAIGCTLLVPWILVIREFVWAAILTAVAVWFWRSIVS